MTKIGLTLTTFIVLAGAGCKKEEPAPAAAKTATPPPATPTPAPPPAPAEDPNAKLLPVGSPAPDVTGKTFDGTEISLAKLKGKPVVVYFYPKDDTPGCTAEAKEFSDDSDELTALGAVVVGVSMDGLDSHKSFTDKYKLNFPLLSDPDGAIAAKVGVNTSRGVAKRTTFVIGKDGNILKVFADVKVDGHSDEVLAAVKQAAGA